MYHVAKLEDALTAALWAYESQEIGDRVFLVAAINDYHRSRCAGHTADPGTFGARWIASLLAASGPLRPRVAERSLA